MSNEGVRISAICGLTTTQTVSFGSIVDRDAFRLRVLVLDHASPGELGAYERALLAARASWRVVRAHAGDPLPDWRAYDAIIGLGGPMGADEDDALSWLGAEKRLISDAVGSVTPFWGVCLGAQLLAASLGARIYRGRLPEVGVRPVLITPAGARDPVFGGLPHSIEAIEWHRDTFELPSGAVLLATSAGRYPNQAFRWGAAAYGVQFHLEMSPATARDWTRVPGYRATLRRVKEIKGRMPLTELDRRTPQMHLLAEKLLARWLRLTSGLRPRPRTA